MKALRGLLVIGLGIAMVLGVLALLRSPEMVQARTIEKPQRTAAMLEVVINEVAWGGTAANFDAMVRELCGATRGSVDHLSTGGVAA